ncbi:hypothetical protein FIBSPDRAFT_861592 [Athelia psychrophila]|uniref:Uncharacterized protein n=1 Tax=Athelia psychrophila TaxID=1759441 RepID=A0A166J7Z9_9AGAM|nr:hypothetical protein FIBSPDRAFT_861592 [Fibularhizoctonia sp. CBS 109695]
MPRRTLVGLRCGSGSVLVRLRRGSGLIGIGQGRGGCTKCIDMNPPNLWGPHWL